VSCALVLSLGVFGCGGEDVEQLPDGAAAKVGDKLIPAAAVRRQLRTSYVGRGGLRAWAPPRYPACVAAHRQLQPDSTRNIRRQCRAEFLIVQAQAASLVIGAEWFARETARRGLDVEDEVERSLERQRRLAPDQLQEVRRREGDAALRLRIDLQRQRLRDAMQVTESEILSYAKANADIYLPSERRVVEVLQADSKRAVRRARQELGDGSTWAQVQDRYGVKPFDQHWSGRKTISEATAPHDAFGRSVFSTRPGRRIGPIQTLNGWFVFEVLEVRPPRHRGLTRLARDTVSTILRSRRLDRVLRAHYADETECAKRYRIPEAPECV
jgi:hypothetical protein